MCESKNINNRMRVCRNGTSISDIMLQLQHLLVINKAHKNPFPEGTNADNDQSFQFYGNQSAFLVQLQKTAAQMQLVTMHQL